MFKPNTYFHFLKKNSISRIILFLALFLSLHCFAQTQKENQFINQYAFNKVIGKKTTLELDLLHSYRSGVEETNPFYKSSRFSGRLWMHYYATKKLKISGFLAYIYNKDIPEINQKELPEIRLAAQGIYYIMKKDYVLTSRFRVEDRVFKSGDSIFDVSFRFREMLKLVYPISIVKFGKGSLYGIASDEIFFKTQSDVTGKDVFDRNRVTVGLGYSFSDAFQFELTYINEYLPRTTVDKMHNIITTKLIFNDIISILRKKNGNIPTYE